MSCCDERLAAVPPRIKTSADLGAPEISRRAVVTGAAALAGMFTAIGPGRAQGEIKKVQLAFCSQLLCIVPYEVARSGGHFRDHGLDVELIYTRGGNAAMQALVGGAVDYAATALDVAIQAYANGADIRRFATTGRLPLFALATSPQNAKTIGGLKDLEGRTVGVSALGNADHALLLFLLHKAGADPAKVQFATLGVNILEALRQGQVDAGLVQEPALTLVVRAGGRALVNLMESADAQKYLGGPYEFMGVAVRAGDIEKRKAEMRALAKGLQDALQAVQKAAPDDLLAALPKELTAGYDAAGRADLRDTLARYRASLYPGSVAIDLAASRRVVDALKVAGLVKPDVDVSGLQDTAIAG